MSVMTVHPHARGEYGRAVRFRPAVNGSPPRTWGIRPRPPASCWRGTVHPHARGEYLRRRVSREDASRFTPTHVGNTSPPLLIAGGRSRFTPTHVGNTYDATVHRSDLAVHPHARGEYMSQSAPAGTVYGSPPRTWGIHLVRAADRSRHRFTPTHVGNTDTDHARCTGPRFTPTHVGNTRLVMGRFARYHGSPPRTWGIRPGISPARPRWPVHPHARGEYAYGNAVDSRPDRFTPTHVGNTTPAMRAVELLDGSPPRTWGILDSRTAGALTERFTPTHVGNTIAC